jgi:two-component system nitrogen regulation response regulator GlnG
LESRPWHGNVRELRNAVEHATILARGGSILPEHLPPPAPEATAAGATQEEEIAARIRQWAESQLLDPAQQGGLYARFLRLVEPPLLQTVIQQYRGQCAAAARRLGLHRTTLRKKLNELGLEEA